MISDGSLPPDYRDQLATFLGTPRSHRIFDKHWSRYRTEERSLANVGRGLSEAQLRGAEEVFGVRFPPDFRSLLSAFVPGGVAWADWTNPEAELTHMLDWIRQAAAFDIRQNDYWHPTWGTRPGDVEEAVSLAIDALGTAPPLLRIRSHRFLASMPCESGNPVISMYQFVDSIYYGNDLADYFHHELGAPRPDWARDEPREVPFWSSIID